MDLVQGIVSAVGTATQATDRKKDLKHKKDIRENQHIMSKERHKVQIETDAFIKEKERIEVERRLLELQLIKRQNCKDAMLIKAVDESDLMTVTSLVKNFEDLDPDTVSIAQEMAQENGHAAVIKILALVQKKIAEKKALDEMLAAELIEKNEQSQQKVGDEEPNGKASHQFKVVTYFIPTNCDVCTNVLMGRLIRPGKHCKVCKMNVHSDCENKIGKDCKKEESMVNEVIDKKPKEKGEHQFEVYNYSFPTYCTLCENLLVGISKQGLKCKVCKKNVHKKCEAEMGADCNDEDNLDNEDAEDDTEILIDDTEELDKEDKNNLVDDEEEDLEEDEEETEE